ncbi:hypothetical protein A1O3_07103 [Capronia epimyces CBS 606.96]|uniref:Transcription factor domain-containing protein n=1 Tax=Capronia epimyces CBS 606.96 TaxID=1182542 RepID=W9YEU3_9EURO|nr:uncharacterized protein A1O3_07103 [Capronia epimyces CBS 606.96]EXJ80819.1 hypothetical protein A1O3_07103 [Capronia epimyces CBS 606.96]
MSPTALWRPTLSPNHEKAIKWYNRAIAGLRQHIEQRGIDPGLALLSCTLFISVEMQQRNVGNALNLIEIGYKLMGQSLSVSSTVQLSPNSAALDEVVTPFFSRHVVLMATLGNPRPPNWSCHVEENMLKSSVLASFSVLDEPKRHLYSIIYQAYEIIRVEQLEPTEERIIKMQCLRQKLLLEDLRQWETSFVNTWSHETRREIVWAVSNLLMYWGVCYIWLSTCTTRLQSAFDEYSERFATILDHAENVLKYSIESTAGQPIFTSEAGPIPPLYFCAIKCRDPLLRRRALVLMRRAPRRESVWAYVPTEKVIEKVIGLEEGDYDATHIEMTGPPLLPPEENRIHHIAVVRKGAVGDTRRLALQLSKYIVGPPDNSRRMVHENVWLEEMTDHQYSP